MSHLTHNRSISETSLSRQSTALMPTTKKETKHHKTETIALANKTNYTLVWYASYDLQTGNGAGPILTSTQPTQDCDALYCICVCAKHAAT